MRGTLVEEEQGRVVEASEARLISHNVLIEWFQEVNSSIEWLTHFLLLLGGRAVPQTI